LGGGLCGKEQPEYRRNVLVEAQAELAHDVAGVLDRIQMPVLLLGGTKDFDRADPPRGAKVV
jgi:hypothetical protein